MAPAWSLEAMQVPPRGGLDLHQLAVVEGLVTGQGLGRGLDLDQRVNRRRPRPSPARSGRGHGHCDQSQGPSPRWASTSIRASAGGGLDHRQLGLVEGMVSRGPRPVHQPAAAGTFTSSRLSRGWSTGQGLGRGVDLDQPRGVAGGLDLDQLGRGDRLDQPKGVAGGVDLDQLVRRPGQARRSA